MLLVRRLLERQEKQAVIEAQIDKDSPFSHPGCGLIPELYMEIMAQAAATVNGWDALMEERPPANGLLVGLNSIEFTGKFAPNKPLLVTVREEMRFGEFISMSGRVEGEEGASVHGEFRVWESDNA